MQYITILDYILLPFYLVLFYMFAKRMARPITEADMRRFFFMAFSLRIFGSFAYAMLVQYYYGYGDSFTFFRGSNIFTDQFAKDPSSIRYLFAPLKELENWYNIIDGNTAFTGYFISPSGSTVMKISAVVSYLAFNKYLIISLFFGLFSFVGQWKLFMVFDDINKKRNRKLLAYAILYSPSIWFWGSGLLKDSICLGGVGFIIHILYNFFVKKKFSFLNFLILIFLVYIVYMIKSYITSIIFVGLATMFFSNTLKSIKNKILKVVMLLVAIMMTGVILYTSDFSSQITKLTEESVAQIQSFQENYQISQDSDESSQAGFGLGELNPTLGSLVLKSPVVIFTCLFRPFIWESKKIMIFFTSLESLLLFLATVYIIFKMGFFNFFKTIFRTPPLLFCFTITILFALIIGFTTFNFGTMIRYKIIFLPFYYFLLVNLYTNYIPSKKIITVTPESTLALNSDIF